MRREPDATWLRIAWPLLVDLLCVLVFAVAGKGSHEAGESDLVVLVIAWPFALAVILAHLLLWVRRADARQVWPGGVTVLATTYALGMLLRVASGRGTALAFLVVAALFLTATLLGWRLVVRLRTGRRSAGAHTD